MYTHTHTTTPIVSIILYGEWLNVPQDHEQTKASVSAIIVSQSTGGSRKHKIQKWTDTDGKQEASWLLFIEGIISSKGH